LALLLVSGVAWSYASGGLAATLLSADLSAAEKLAALRAFFLDLGVAAPAAYVAFVTVEVVVAPLPGAMLYAPAVSCLAASGAAYSPRWATRSGPAWLARSRGCSANG
jgi:hypothetical protein